jgi:hypothetical protein
MKIDDFKVKPLKKSNRGRKPDIHFGSNLEDTIFNIVTIYNNRFPKKKVKLEIAKTIVKRGIDACLGNGKTAIDRTEFGLARLRIFLIKKSGGVNTRYIADDDLIKK